MFMNRTINEDSPQTAPVIKYEKSKLKFQPKLADIN